MICYVVDRQIKNEKLEQLKLGTAYYRLITHYDCDYNT